MIPKLFVIIPILIVIQGVYSANILFYINMGSYSHRVPIYPLADALAKRGHKITFISPFHNRDPNPNPNITEIVPKKSAKTMESFLSTDFDVTFRIQRKMTSNSHAFYPTALKACEDFLTSPELQEFLEKTTHLDLLILDHCMSDCAMGIAHKYSAKHIFFSTTALISSENDFYGLVPESSAIPEVEIFPYRVPMSFMERVSNALQSLHFRYEHFKYITAVDGLIRKHMKNIEDMPFTDDLARNTSLVLYTGDVVTDYVRSFPPLIIDVAGLHCKQAKRPEELPKDIKKFLRKDVNGIVYISLGSMLTPSNLPKEMVNAFIITIEAFPELKFLWKWTGPIPEKIPGNLMLSKWFPQVDILGHPKTKAFITQGGRPSILESLCNGVPMIAFPVLGDQDANAIRLNDMGGNILLELGTVTGDKLKHAIHKTVYDQRMRDRVTQLKNILQDRPMSPLDTAVWWTEYVLRHPDTSHLRPSGFNQTWYQRRLIDVWAFLLIILILTLALIIASILAIPKIYFMLLKSNNSKVKSS